MRAVLHASSHWLPVGSDGDQLHLRRMGDPAGPTALAVHGAVENGRIFYSGSGRGFAPFLARRGWDVWVLDLRGRGLSRPRVSRHSRWGQTESIVEDLTVAAGAVLAERGRLPEAWLSHSWGGVLVASHLVRFDAHREAATAVVHFGAKRRVLARHLGRLVPVDLMWKTVGLIVARAIGYLPARILGWGADDESRLSHRHSVAWIRECSAWVDPGDGFDYAEAARQCRLSPTLWLAGGDDRVFGNPADVHVFIAECRQEDQPCWLLARSEGFLHDYGHIDMLTHPDADADHFPKIAAWLEDRVGDPGPRPPRGQGTGVRAAG